MLGGRGHGTEKSRRSSSAPGHSTSVSGNVSLMIRIVTSSFLTGPWVSYFQCVTVNSGLFISFLLLWPALWFGSGRLNALPCLVLCLTAVKNDKGDKE